MVQHPHDHVDQHVHRPVPVVLVGRGDGGSGEAQPIGRGLVVPACECEQQVRLAQPLLAEREQALGVGGGPRGAVRAQQVGERRGVGVQLHPQRERAESGRAARVRLVAEVGEGRFERFEPNARGDAEEGQRLRAVPVGE